MTIDAGHSAAPGVGRVEGGYDAIVIGGSLEGMAAAWYLAKAGLKTVLLEPGAHLGGDAQCTEVALGCRASDADHVLQHLDKAVVRDLDLYKHGLEFASRNLATAIVGPGGAPVLLERDARRDAPSENALSEQDHEAYTQYLKLCEEIGGALGVSAANAAPRQDAFILSDAYERLTKAANDDQRRFIQYAALSPADELASAMFSSDVLTSAYLFDTTLGYDGRPSDMGTALAAAYRWTNEISGVRGACALPKGGMEAFARSVEQALENSNVEVRLETRVASVLIEWDAAAGVELEGGGQIRANTVVSAFDAHTTFFDLIGAERLDIEFHNALLRRRPRLGLAKFHVAVRGPLDFFRGDERVLGSRMIFSTSPPGLEEAYRAALRGMPPKRPWMEVVIPSIHDDRLVAENRHVLSCVIHPAPFPENEERAEVLREGLKDAALSLLNERIPGILERIVDVKLRLPTDYAKDYGLHPTTWANRPPLAAQWMEARDWANGARFEGFAFCGPDVLFAPGLSGAAGRRAGQIAAKRAKKKMNVL